jgi:hypothetical protein
VFRVGPEVPAGKQSDVIAITGATRQKQGQVVVTGANSSILGSEKFGETVRVYQGGIDPAKGGCQGPELKGRFELTDTVGPQRKWRWVGPVTGDRVCAVSSGGGYAEATVYSTNNPGATASVPAAPDNQKEGARR